MKATHHPSTSWHDATASTPSCAPLRGGRALRRFAAAALAIAGIAVQAADYNWTGLGDGHSWSDADNWTNAAGVAVAPVVSTSTKSSYLFPVDDTGLVVVQDMTGAIIFSTLTFERTSTAPVTVEMSSKELNCVLIAGMPSAVTVPEGMTLLWKTDPDRWNNADVIKDGPGKVVIDYMRSPQTERGLVLNDGTVEVAATSADTKFHVKMGGSDPDNLPVFRNLKDGETVGALNTLRLGGTVDLGETTLHVGAAAQSTRLGNAPTNILPAVEGAGTLVFQNERVSQLVGRAPSFGIALDRADLVAPDFGASIFWLFDDADNPKADAIGSGSRMTVSGSPAVVSDAERGSVLSFSGGAYFKGPDANQWLDEFDPAAGYTLAFWLKPGANCDAAAKIFFLGTGTPGNALAIRLNNSTTAGLMVTAWGSNQTPAIGTLRDGVWHHIAVTYSGAPQGSPNMRLYLDGENVHSWSVWNYAPVKKDLYIGNMGGTAWSNSDGSTPYTGLMDDFVLAPRCLSPKDVENLVSESASSVFGPALLNNVAAESSGTLAVEGNGVSMKTLSGAALAGGVEMQKAGSTLAVGANAGSAATAFKGVLGGAESTLVKEGADYALALSGAAPAITNVEVKAGTLTLRHPRARAGLAAWYPFDDADDFGADAAPGGLALVDTNAVATLTAVADGVRGGAAHFPGGMFLTAEAKNAKPSNFPRGNGSFTVSVWMRPTAAACIGTVPIFSWGDGADQRLSMVRFNGANALNFTTYGAGNDLAVGSLTLSDGEWHHLVVTYDGPSRTKKLYYDGALKGTKVVSADLDVGATKSSFEIGHTSVISSRARQFYTGDMDEFMVFDYAWGADEVAAEFDKDAPSAIAATSFLPEPVARWTFDGADPLAAEGGDAALALSEASGTVTFESGDAICGKAARFSSSSGFLALDTFPSDIIPSGNAPFTVIARYRPDMAGGEYNSVVVGWGDDNGWSAGTLFRISSGYYGPSAQAMFRSFTLQAPGGYRTDLADKGPDRMRWHTVAAVYEPTGATSGAIAGYARLFDDGEPKAVVGLWNTPMALPARNFTIGANDAGGKAFRGLVDDVQIFDTVLSAGQLRMIAEQLEASKGQATTGTAVPAGVLAAQPDVAVAAGATLRVESTETIGTLSGAGDVEIAPLARLNIASAGGFAGTVTGGGLVGIADGATLEFGDGSSPLFDIDCTLALGANVTVNTTARAGRLLLAEAASFSGAENLESWTATTPSGVHAHFVLSPDGTKLYLSMPQGTVVFFR